MREAPEFDRDLTTRGKVRRLLALGWTPTSIGETLGITRQAVYDHMEAIRKEAETEASA